MFNQYVFHNAKSSTLPIKVFKKSINLDNISEETVLNIRENIQERFYDGILLLNVCALIQWFEHFFQKEEWFQNLKKENNLVRIISLNETKSTIEWNQKNCFFMEMIEKCCKNKYLFSEVMNEYFVGVYGINYLRLIIPNFVFTYYVNTSISNQISLHREYVPGVSFSEYMKKLCRRPRRDDFGVQEFLSIFLQIICSLEIAQQTLQFCHFDLHGKNIILRPVSNHTITYPIFDICYQFRECKQIPVFIDFEFSTIRYKKLIISNDPLCYDWGIYPFFISGCDMLRFVIGCLFYSHPYRNDQRYTGYFLHKYMEMILLKFYGMNMDVFYEHESIFRKHNFNFTMNKVIFSTPLQFLRFFDENEPEILRILELTNFSLHRSEHKMNYTNLKFSDRRTRDFLGEAIEFHPTKHFFTFFTRKSDVMSLEEFVHSIQASKHYVPNLHINKRLQIQHFFQRYNWIISTYEYYYTEFVILGKRENSGFFWQHINELTYKYRQVCTLYYYHSFLVESLHGIPRFQEDSYYDHVINLFK